MEKKANILDKEMEMESFIAMILLSGFSCLLYSIGITYLFTFLFLVLLLSLIRIKQEEQDAKGGKKRMKLTREQNIQLIEGEIRYEQAEGTHTFHMCDECGKKGCRGRMCIECWEKELDSLKQKETKK